MNFKRKSTEGFSIGYILNDFSSGVANYAQMTIQSLDQSLCLFSTKYYTLFFHQMLSSVLIYLKFCHFSRFLGKLLWKYGEDTSVPGKECCPFSKLYYTHIFLQNEYFYSISNCRYLCSLTLYSCSNTKYYMYRTLHSIPGKAYGSSKKEKMSLS